MIKGLEFPSLLLSLQSNKIIMAKKNKEDIDINKPHFYVDIPQIDKEEWLNVDFFETREEAIKYAQEHFGADENGMVSLISQS
jgi:hypothetical protein